MTKKNTTELKGIVINTSIMDTYNDVIVKMNEELEKEDVEAEEVISIVRDPQGNFILFYSELK